MSRNERVVLLSAMLVMLLILGIVTVIVLANRPFVDYRITSPTALPLTDPFIATQTARPSPTLNPTTAMTVLPPPSTTNIETTACGWMWATQIQPELSAQLQRQLVEALGIDAIEARVESYGENCLNRDGSVRYFAAMSTDFRITVWQDLPIADADAALPLLSETVLTILAQIEDYPFEAAPGRQPGNLSIEFPVLVVHHRTTYWLSTNYRSAMEALSQGLTGSELFDALGGLRQQDEVLPT